MRACRHLLFRKTHKSLSILNDFQFCTESAFFQYVTKIIAFPRWEHNLSIMTGKRLYETCCFPNEIVKITKMWGKVVFLSFFDFDEIQLELICFPERCIFLPTWSMSNMVTFLTRKWRSTKKLWKNIGNHISGGTRPSDIGKRNVFCILVASQKV